MRGETPRPEDYLGEFPELSDSLVRLFEVQAAASLPTVWRGSQGLADSPIDPGTQRDNIARATGSPSTRSSACWVGAAWAWFTWRGIRP